MVTAAHKPDIRHSSYVAEAGTFRLPNPGDVFMLVAFGWAAICFLMVTGAGARLARQAAGLSASQTVRDLLLTEQTAIAGLMIAGLVGIAVSFWFLYRYQSFAVGLFIFSMSFASAQWKPLHDFAFILKYVTIVYLAATAGLFALKNVWRMLGTRGYRLLLVYVAWFFFVAFLNGLKTPDLWYATTELTLMVGFGLIWLRHLDNIEALERFNRVFGYVGIAATVFHLLAVVVYPQFTAGGRFVSMFNRATGFATIYSLFVVAMFWLSMYEKRIVWQRVFTLFALIGYGLILWSGTRNATVATLIGIGGLWWVFRTRIFAYLAVAGMVALLVQIILGGSENLEFLSERLASTENTRLEAWKLYTELAFKSPIFGYGYSGLVGAVYGESLIGVLSTYNVRINVPGVHNYYIGLAARFGFVGLGLTLAIFYLGFRQAWRVVFGNRVSRAVKQVYVLPAALVLLVALQGLFEDTIGSTGKGSLHGLVLSLAIPVLYILGGRLLQQSQERS